MLLGEHTYLSVYNNIDFTSYAYAIPLNQANFVWRSDPHGIDGLTVQGQDLHD